MYEENTTDRRTNSSDYSDLLHKTVSPSDFCEFVPWACLQLAAECTAVVIKVRAVDPSGKSNPNLSKSTTTKSRGTPSDSELIGSKTQSGIPLLSSQVLENNINMTAVYEGEHNLVTVRILKNKTVPRSLLKIIDLTLPFHPYLNTIVIDRANQGIVYELSNLLKHSNITEVYLDNSYVPQANYYLLLDCPNCKVLSLSMCKITDIVVQTIANKLDIGTTGAESLIVLNLATNRITDIGAKYLADMLRTNRKLAYLNLAGNQISDKGARQIFDVLKVFPLTEDEVCSSLRRHGAFKTKELQLVTNLLNDSSFSPGLEKGNLVKKESARRRMKSSTIQKQPSVESLKTSTSKTPLSKLSKLAQPSLADQDRALLLERAHASVVSVMGKYNDPYSRQYTTIIDGVMRCRGNKSLCYLNLSFNNLTYICVPIILDVLTYQRNDNAGGLINIRIDGNFMPKECLEYHRIDEMLNSLAVHAMSKKQIIKSKSVSKTKKNLESAASMN